MFCPNYQKFKEAKQLIDLGAAFNISSAEDLKKLIERLIKNPAATEAIGISAKNYVMENKGATARVLKYIQENRLLTTA